VEGAGGTKDAPSMDEDCACSSLLAIHLVHMSDKDMEKQSDFLKK
jgi:hypothetical protein